MPPGGCETGRGRSGRDGRKIKWKLSEVNTRIVSRGQNELIGKFKMAAGDVGRFVFVLIERVVIAAQCTATFQDVLCSPKFRYY